MPILLDLNNRKFQQAWFALQKEDRAAVLQTCAKLAAMEWSAIYRDKGLNWELIKSRLSVVRQVVRFYSHVICPLCETKRRGR